MPDEPQKWTGLTLEARHVPEPAETYDPSAHDDPNHVTGFIQIGTEIEGVFVPLAQRHASGLVADIERAHKAGFRPDVPADDDPPQPQE